MEGRLSDDVMDKKYMWRAMMTTLYVSHSPKKKSVRRSRNILK